MRGLKSYRPGTPGRIPSPRIQGKGDDSHRKVRPGPRLGNGGEESKIRNLNTYDEFSPHSKLSTRGLAGKKTGLGNRDQMVSRSAQIVAQNRGKGSRPERVNPAPSFKKKREDIRRVKERRERGLK